MVLRRRQREFLPVGAVRTSARVPTMAAAARRMMMAPAGRSSCAAQKHRALRHQACPTASN